MANHFRQWLCKRFLMQLSAKHYFW